ncbi:MAG: hypothetical protein KatS3mg113_0200 [Planctomycetaceae bacterium]|nr:MAG: hypothetical protein KatS3mg113_0200 [Planctomycetaceae bacterium]
MPDETETKAAELTSLLAEKEALIATLTEQLELAAEQLDRLQRMGVDRRRGSSVGLPAELVQEHRQLIEEWQRVIQQWDDLQAGLTLGRIEMRLDELRDLVLHLRDRTLPAALSNPPVTAEGPAPSASDLPSAEESHAGGTSCWEQLKSQMLREETPPAHHQPTESAEAPELPAVPAPIDVSQATRDELVAAVESRDDFIAAVLRRLRYVEDQLLPVDWAPLVAHDANEAQRLQQISAQLAEKMRLAELELSLERARLAREQHKLHQQQELLEKQLKKLGIHTLDELSDQPPQPQSSHDRRLIRFLGIPRN